MLYSESHYMCTDKSWHSWKICLNKHWIIQDDVINLSKYYTLIVKCFLQNYAEFSIDNNKNIEKNENTYYFCLDKIWIFNAWIFNVLHCCGKQLSSFRFILSL